MVVVDEWCRLREREVRGAVRGRMVCDDMCEVVMLRKRLGRVKLTHEQFGLAREHANPYGASRLTTRQ